MVKIAVIGAGLLGVKIAGELAYHGHRVKIYDSSIKNLNSVYQRMEEDKKNLREEGLLLQKSFIGQVLCMSRLEETVCDVEIVIECVIEDLEVKRDLFERISHLMKPDAVLSSNTLRLKIDDVVQRTNIKERTMGLRFLYPVYGIPEVEITPSSFSSQKAIQKVRIMLERMGKTLFFRSGGEPLILSEEQREERKKARLEQIKSSSGVGHLFESMIPALSHQGNVPQSEEKKKGMDEDRDPDCAICMDRMRDCLLSPCHHMITCYECSKMLLNRRDGCPICRKDITELIRVYHS
ncbi:probable 3-hydroxybutyryl-CoA dehydrogenase [Ylistrum balloti]|uniref:probable 3-hydroxybutyryl-CoA dehydrogenase n=1 Tax=Ylistrum balloti TaxID=509963 RepID=UPI002905D670|nr:probable 3-hydroxybutyryl-CoA dehydrogenase [Ylistrum balloti]